MPKKWICALCAAALLLSGCQPKEEPINPEDVALYPVIVNGISFDKAPERIVSLCPALTALVEDLGQGEAVVGVSQEQEPDTGLQAVGSADEPDVDAVIALEPDLLLTQQPLPAGVINRLQEEGITSLVLDVPENFYQVEAQYQRIAELLWGEVPEQYRDLGIQAGNTRAQETFAQYRSNLEQMARRAASGEAKSFVFALSPDGSRVATGKTTEGNLIGIIGCNIAQDASSYQMDFEQIVQQNPDYIFVPTGDSIAIGQNENYQQLAAVAEGRIVEIDTADLASQNPLRLIELYQSVCEHIYGT